MSSIDDLIQELCPNGVRFERLGTIGRWYGGGTPSKAKAEYWTDGTIPWVSPKDMGARIVTSALDRITEAAVNASATKLVPPTSVVMVVRSSILDHTFPTALVPVSVALNQDMKAVVPNDNVQPEYLAYVLSSRGPEVLRTASKVGGSVTSINSPQLMDFRIPVPPLRVQREIVTILDRFAELEAELARELEAERGARRTQYDFYRDSLVRFSASKRPVALGELGSFFGGLTGKSKADFTDGNARFVTYMNVLTNIAVRTDLDYFVRVAPGERQRTLAYGDILFTGSSESAAEAGMTSVVTTRLSEPLYLNSFCIGFRPRDLDIIDPEFAKHLFRSSSMRTQIIKTANGVTRFNVSKERLAKIEVPLPSRGEQRRVGRVLDSLEALTTNLGVGLPAELLARRKQYEHYRDRLLTFKELAA